MSDMVERIADMLVDDHITLLRENERLRGEVERLTDERDAAVKDADLHRNRCASILFSGAMDNFTAREVHQWMRDYVDAKAERDALKAALPETLKRGCRVCGIGADGKAYGYVCSRSDCPTKITCGGAT